MKGRVKRTEAGVEALSSWFQSHLAPVYLRADGQGACALKISRHGLASALRRLCSVVMPAGWRRITTVVFARVAVYGDVAAADETSLLLNDGGIFSSTSST